MFIISLLQIYAIFHIIARDNTEKTQTFPRHLQIFSRFSFAIEVQREEMSTIFNAPNNQTDFGQMTK